MYPTELMDEMLTSLPPNFVQHFEPTPEFMTWWVKYVGDQFVFELGAGMCDFTKLMHDNGIKVLAIEPRANDAVRRECMSCLLPLSIGRAKVLSETPAIVVVARPDHSGWVETIPDHIHHGSEFIYIGLPENFAQDIGCYGWEVLYRDAGADGEQVLRISI